jgi:ribosomal protein L11 methyltransferase
MAPEVAAIAAPHAALVLAGLLSNQRDNVIAAYAAAGFTLDTFEERGDWSILRLTAPAIPVPGLRSDDKGRENWARDI